MADASRAQPPSPGDGPPPEPLEVTEHRLWLANEIEGGRGPRSRWLPPLLQALGRWPAMQRLVRLGGGFPPSQPLGAAFLQRLLARIAWGLGKGPEAPEGAPYPGLAMPLVPEWPDPDDTQPQWWRASAMATVRRPPSTTSSDAATLADATFARVTAPIRAAAPPGPHPGEPAVAMPAETPPPRAGNRPAPDPATAGRRTGDLSFALTAGDGVHLDGPRPDATLQSGPPVQLMPGASQASPGTAAAGSPKTEPPSPPAGPPSGATPVTGEGPAVARPVSATPDAPLSGSPPAEHPSTAVSPQTGATPQNTHPGVTPLNDGVQPDVGAHQPPAGGVSTAANPAPATSEGSVATTVQSGEAAASHAEGASETVPALRPRPDDAAAPVPAHAAPPAQPLETQAIPTGRSSDSAGQQPLELQLRPPANGPAPSPPGTPGGARASTDLSALTQSGASGSNASPQGTRAETGDRMPIRIVVDWVAGHDGGGLRDRLAEAEHIVARFQAAGIPVQVEAGHAVVPERHALAQPRAAADYALWTGSAGPLPLGDLAILEGSTLVAQRPGMLRVIAAPRVTRGNAPSSMAALRFPDLVVAAAEDGPPAATAGGPPAITQRRSDLPPAAGAIAPPPTAPGGSDMPPGVGGETGTGGRPPLQPLLSADTVEPGALGTPRTPAPPPAEASTAPLSALPAGGAPGDAPQASASEARPTSGGVAGSVAESLASAPGRAAAVRQASGDTPSQVPATVPATPSAPEPAGLDAPHATPDTDRRPAVAPAALPLPSSVQPHLLDTAGSPSPRPTSTDPQPRPSRRAEPAPAVASQTLALSGAPLGSAWATIDGGAPYQRRAAAGAAAIPGEPAAPAGFRWLGAPLASSVSLVEPSPSARAAVWLLRAPAQAHTEAGPPDGGGGISGGPRDGRARARLDLVAEEATPAVQAAGFGGRPTAPPGLTTRDGAQPEDAPKGGARPSSLAPGEATAGTTAFARSAPPSERGPQSAPAAFATNQASAGQTGRPTTPEQRADIPSPAHSAPPSQPTPPPASTGTDPLAGHSAATDLAVASVQAVTGAVPPVATPVVPPSGEATSRSNNDGSPAGAEHPPAAGMQADLRPPAVDAMEPTRPAPAGGDAAPGASAAGSPQQLQAWPRRPAVQTMTLTLDWEPGADPWAAPGLMQQAAASVAGLQELGVLVRFVRGQEAARPASSYPEAGPAAAAPFVLHGPQGLVPLADVEVLQGATVVHLNPAGARLQVVRLNSGALPGAAHAQRRPAPTGHAELRLVHVTIDWPEGSDPWRSGTPPALPADAVRRLADQGVQVVLQPGRPVPSAAMLPVLPSQAVSIPTPTGRVLLPDIPWLAPSAAAAPAEARFVLRPAALQAHATATPPAGASPAFAASTRAGSPFELTPPLATPALGVGWERPAGSGPAGPHPLGGHYHAGVPDSLMPGTERPEGAGGDMNQVAEAAGPAPHGANAADAGRSRAIPPNDTTRSVTVPVQGSPATAGRPAGVKGQAAAPLDWVTGGGWASTAASAPDQLPPLWGLQALQRLGGPSQPLAGPYRPLGINVMFFETDLPGGDGVAPERAGQEQGWRPVPLQRLPDELAAVGAQPAAPDAIRDFGDDQAFIFIEDAPAAPPVDPATVAAAATGRGEAPALSASGAAVTTVQTARSDAHEEQHDEPPSVDVLARQVYAVIKQRLAVERERAGRRERW